MSPSWRQPIFADWPMQDTVKNPPNSRAPHWVKWSLDCDCHQFFIYFRGFSTQHCRQHGLDNSFYKSYPVFYRICSSILASTHYASTSPDVAKCIMMYKIFSSLKQWCNPILFNSHRCWSWEHLPINYLLTIHWVCVTP